MRTLPSELPDDPTPEQVDAWMRHWRRFAVSREFSIYAQGVGPETAILPQGWQQRLVRVQTPATSPAIGLCLEVHDLAVSKYIAGRPKDLEYTRELMRHGMTKKKVLMERLAATRLDAARNKLAAQRIKFHFG